MYPGTMNAGSILKVETAFAALKYQNKKKSIYTDSSEEIEEI